MPFSITTTAGAFVCRKTAALTAWVVACNGTRQRAQQFAHTTRLCLRRLLGRAFRHILLRLPPLRLLLPLLLMLLLLLLLLPLPALLLAILCSAPELRKPHQRLCTGRDTIRQTRKWRCIFAR